MNKHLITSAVISGIAALSFSSTYAADTTVVVSPQNLQGWSFVDDSTDLTGTGNFVNGPGTPPAGKGSVHFQLTGNGDRQVIGTFAYAGTPLSSINYLQYSTYRASDNPGNFQAIALQFDVKYRTADTLYGGRLVYEPYQGALGVPVPTGVWQTWTPLTGRWWASKTNEAGSNGSCPQSNPCTWAEILNVFPQATISGRLLLRAGNTAAGFDGNADALKITVDGNSTIYDFELGPTNKDECKNGGWQGFYKNQGACVSHYTGSKD